MVLTAYYCWSWFGSDFTGNDIIHQLTSTSNYKLKIVLRDWSDITKYAEYSSFSVAGESDFYRLSIQGYTGDAGKSLYIGIFQWLKVFFTYEPHHAKTCLRGLSTS